MAVSANRLELLQIADAVAREKAIDRGIVIAAMEDAIQKAARSRYGSETEVRAEINPKTGEMRLSRLLLVVEQVENDAIHISIEDARRRNPAAQVGNYIAEQLPPLEYGRIAAQSAKQVIVQKRREPRGPQIFLSRTHPQFMAKLFAQEVPEIYDNIVEVKAVARDPGSRAKIAVISRDSSVDPVGP